MKNFIIISVLALIVAAALFYLIREKRRGRKCIGCPAGEYCSGGCKTSNSL